MPGVSLTPVHGHARGQPRTPHWPDFSEISGCYLIGKCPVYLFVDRFDSESGCRLSSPASRLPWQGSLKMQILLHTSLFSSHVLDPSPVRFVTDNSESFVETVTCRLIKTMTSDLCISMHVPAMVVLQLVASVTSARVDEHRNCSTGLQVGYRPRCEFQPQTSRWNWSAHNR